MARYKQQQDGDWIRPQMRRYRLKCCDCGLIHVLDFKIVGKRIVFRATRNYRATAAARRASQTLAGIRKLNAKMKRLDNATDQAVVDQIRFARKTP